MYSSQTWNCFHWDMLVLHVPDVASKMESLVAIISVIPVLSAVGGDFMEANIVHLILV